MDTRQDRERCLEKLSWAIAQLQGTPDPNQLSKISDLIIQSMTGPWRFFHTPEHIFEVGNGGDAIEVLAALFHDLVYVQVDQSVGINIIRYIAPFMQDVGGQLVILEQEELPSDRMFEIVLEIFGFTCCQTLLPMAGQNEFLSALICVKALENALTASQLAQISACIEATIPFRQKTESGLSPSDLLYQRLIVTNQKFNLGWTDTDIQTVVKRSVRLANRDVENFASLSAAHFLDNTWNLLPETNHDLTHANSYTVRGYRTSLQKMEGFMSFLKPEQVFQQFQDEPNHANYQGLMARTHRNLEIAKLYLGTKLTSIAVLEALSYKIGRDIPLSIMMGELPTEEITFVGLEQFLPDIAHPCQPDLKLDQAVLALLEKGRSSSSSYDVKNSPVATFMVKSIGFTAIRQLLIQAKKFFKGTITAEDFLLSGDAKVIIAINQGVIKLFESRKESIQIDPDKFQPSSVM
jgi:hypothetical protein